MQKAKADVLVALFAYSGNGGVASTIPEIAFWLAQNVHTMKADARIGRVGLMKYCDTPITMTRNRAFADALAGNFDMVLLLDSDNEPDAYLGTDPAAKPFWSEAFDLAYQRLLQDLPTIVAAPYCGPPVNPVTLSGGEVPYLFQWESRSSETTDGYQLRLISRREASMMAGLYRVAALPTGVCLVTTNTYRDMVRPWFRYEMNADESTMLSTEDVYFTRNASLYWQSKLGENVCFAACDSWAAHAKVKYVGKPTAMPVSTVGADLVRIAREGYEGETRVVDMQIGPPPEQPHVAEAATDEPASDAPPELPADEAFDVAPEDPKQNPMEPLKYIMFGGRKIGCRAERVLTPQEIDAILDLNASLGPPSDARMLVLNPGVGDIAGLFTPRQKFLVGDLNTNVIAAQMNWDAERVGMWVPADATFHDAQDLDLVFIDTPPDEDILSWQLAKWWGHIRIGGTLAGYGYAVNEAVTNVLDRMAKETGVQPSLIGDTCIWRVVKPASPEASAA